MDIEHGEAQIREVQEEEKDVADSPEIELFVRCIVNLVMLHLTIITELERAIWANNHMKGSQTRLEIITIVPT